MQRKLLFLACFFVSAVAFAQEYPFVYYTPRDGLVSNRVKSIYQDSKGRIYFITQNGLSVYDGSRFTNYTSEDGLQSDVVNFVMEMGEDSVWVVSNASGINYLSKGKLKDLVLKNSATPIINYLYRDNANNLYAAADEGLFVFHENSFTRVPFADSLGNDVSQYMISVIAVDDYLLCLTDPSLKGDLILYLYSCRNKKIVSQTKHVAIQSMAKARDGRIWLSTEKGIRELNKAELQKGKILLQELSPPYKNLSNKTGLIFFDNDNNSWLVDGNGSLTRYDINGNSTAYNRSSGLHANLINFVFKDRENIIWLASDGGGVAKLMHSNITVSEKPFGLSVPSSLHLSSSGNDILLYSYSEGSLVR